MSQLKGHYMSLHAMIVPPPPLSLPFSPPPPSPTPVAEPKPTDLAPSASEPPGSFPEHRNINPFGIGGKQKEGEEEELEEELEPTRVREVE